MAIAAGRIIGILMLSVGLTAVSPAASAAVKENATCKRSGQIAIVKGTKFTCTRKAKKLVWVKAPTTQKPAAGTVLGVEKVSDSRCASRTRNKVADGKGGATYTSWDCQSWLPSKGWGFLMRFNSEGVLERKINNGASDWVAEGKGLEQFIHPIRSKAFEEITKWRSQRTIENFVPSVFISDKFSKGVQDTFLEALNRSLAYWDPAIPKGSRLPILFITEKDTGLLYEKLRALIPNASEADSMAARTLQMGIFQASDCTRWSLGGGVSLSSSGPIGIIAGCSKYSADDLYLINVTHEMTHAFQSFVIPGIKWQNMTFDSSAEDGLREIEIEYPLHILEGSADAFGAGMIFSDVRWYSDAMDWGTGRVKQNKQLLRPKTTEEIVSLLIQGESYLPRFDKVGAADGLGDLLWEYFIADKGVAAYVDLHKRTLELGSFYPAFKAVVGVELSAYYLQAAPYILQAWERVQP